MSRSISLCLVSAVALFSMTLVLGACEGIVGDGERDEDAIEAGLDDWATASLEDPEEGDPEFIPDEETREAMSAGLPQGCVRGSFKAYHGLLHAHTGLSDGAQTPTAAFKRARAAGVDFFAVTDHLDPLRSHGHGRGYSTCADHAAATRTQSFLPLCGFEANPSNASQKYKYHLNVFFQPSLWTVPTHLQGLYNQVRTCKGCAVQFNHPAGAGEGAFAHFAFHSSIAGKINQMEFSYGLPTKNMSLAVAWPRFFQALDKGWRVSPTFNQDNHHADWATANDFRTGVFMPGLSATNLRTAMRARRTFATARKDATIKLLAQGACWMGSVLSGLTTANLSVEANDPRGGTYTSVDLFGPGMKRLSTVLCNRTSTCRAQFAVNVSGLRYVVARANSDDKIVVVSAPIWFK